MTYDPLKLVPIVLASFWIVVLHDAPAAAQQPALQVPVPTVSPLKQGQTGEIDNETAAPVSDGQEGHAEQNAQDAGGEDVTDEDTGAGAEQAEIVPPPPPPFEDDPGCEASLAGLGVQYEMTGSADGENGCGFERAYRVDAINGVTVEPDTQMRCETVAALARWLRDAVAPAANAMSMTAIARGGAPVELTGIRNAATYVCRRRNNRPDGKLSYHAIGAAIDIRGFDFSGRAPIIIEPRDNTGTIEEAFQKAVKASACLYFGTVLGPGSDGYHEDHLHFDVAQRRGGYKYCR